MPSSTHLDRARLAPSADARPTLTDIADSLDPVIAAARAENRHAHADALVFAQRWLRLRDILLDPACKATWRLG